LTLVAGADFPAPERGSKLGDRLVASSRSGRMDRSPARSGQADRQLSKIKRFKHQREAEWAERKTAKAARRKDRRVVAASGDTGAAKPNAA
jgi:hypothetical protein